MRQQVGDQLICNHPNGQAAICTISEIDDKKVIVQVDEWLEADNELPINITIVQGLPKGNKLEMIFQKGTELGATAFQIFEADRSIAKWEDRKSTRLNSSHVPYTDALPISAICTISEIDDKKVIVQVDEWLEADNELPINITIVQGLPKGNKLEMIFQKGTELGATAFQIFEADRSIAKW